MPAESRSGARSPRLAEPRDCGRYRERVTTRIGMVAAAIVLAGAAAACSSPAPTPPAQPGTLPPGTASVTVNGTDLGTTQDVSCSQQGSMTTITTGASDAGATAVIDNAAGLTATSVSIRNLGGFTGSYWKDLDGNAEVHATGRTLLVTGTAAGFDTDRPSHRNTGTFAIRVTC
jgi:ipoprotein LpqH